MFREVFNITLGVLLGLVLLLLIGVAGVVMTPSAREWILEKAVEVANEQTDYDIDLGRIYLSPFHHSPMVLYRAYKGEGDLPLEIEIDSLFVGHRGQDTLIYTRALRLKATARIQDSGFRIQGCRAQISFECEARKSLCHRESTERWPAPLLA